MVFVNSQKFACASCIKGHRSSSCHHAHRPLFEIKKKGRPVSQCETCRELRKKKRKHVKCTCTDLTASEGGSTLVENCGRRLAQRTIPATPTLPNGLRDLLSQHQRLSPLLDDHSRKRVDSLLNPCNCKSVWKCKCLGRHMASPPKTVANTKEDKAGPVTHVSSPMQTSCGGSNLGVSTCTTSLCAPKMHASTASSHENESQLTSNRYIHSSQSSLRRDPNADVDAGSTLHLPPLKPSPLSDPDVDELVNWTLPSLKRVFPPTQEITDANVMAVAALTRCGCGRTCVCPGCKEHRGEEFTSLADEDCPDKCGSCVDNMGGAVLPIPSSISGSSPSTELVSACHVPLGAHSHSRVQGKRSVMSTLDHFYAIAALLPPPPQNRASGPGILDPTNVTVYQHKSGSKQDWRKAAGLVQIPPLSCCQGKCKCPSGLCGCGKNCGGSCARHDPPEHSTEGSQPLTLNTGGSGGENPSARLMGCCAEEWFDERTASKPVKDVTPVTFQNAVESEDIAI